METQLSCENTDRESLVGRVESTSGFAKPARLPWRGPSGSRFSAVDEVEDFFDDLVQVRVGETLGGDQLTVEDCCQTCKVGMLEEMGHRGSSGTTCSQGCNDH